MITPQDIREKSFEKAVFGGYDMNEVDDFLEQLAVELTALQKENGVLKAKMKVLVDKIEEYRGSEKDMHEAILSAQKMGSMIEKESREKGDRILGEAMTEAERVRRQAREEVENEKTRLAEAKRSSVEFIDSMNKLCNMQLEFLQRISGADFVKSASRASAASVSAVPAGSSGSEIHETVKSIEETVGKAVNEPVSDVSPEIKSLLSQVDENPTRSYGILRGEDALD
ncbi:MAG: DivIVA domain-containing protein [Butyricicoccus sp.]|nr:DivIVA domain-containing protein [Butyricicoccus sp.]